MKFKNPAMLNGAIVACAAWLSALAADGSPVSRDIDTLAVAEHADVWSGLLNPVNGNPARQHGRYATNLSEVAASMDNRQANTPLFYQTGKGQTAFNLRANSYLHLTKNTTVWGSAGYATGKRRAVKWNSTADFLLLYPYVMADTLGGNLTFERYAFSAGWASRWRKATVGADVDFRAEHEYRTTDPRPRNIVTDLTVRLGAAYPVTLHYALGISAAIRFYKQTNDVAFYREAGVIPEYHMMGLGMDYKRFSGSNASAYYKSTGYEAGLDWSTLKKSGTFASALYSYAPYHRILPNLNALPISVLGVQTWKGEVGWKRSGGRDGFILKAMAEYERRVGNEQVAGNSSSGEYRIVDQLTTYRAHTARYGGEALYAVGQERRKWNVALSAGFIDYAAHYVFPARKLSWSKAFVEVKAQWQQVLPHRQLLSASAAAAYDASVSSSMKMPYAAMSAANVDLMDKTYASVSADMFRVQADVQWTLPLRRYAFFVKAGGSYAGAGNFWHAWAQRLAAGFTF